MLASLLIVAGAALGVPAAGVPITEWAVVGLLAGVALLAAYVFVLRHDLSLAVPAMTVAVVLGQLRDGMVAGTTAALAGSLAGVVLTSAIGWWMFGLFRRVRDRRG